MAGGKARQVVGVMGEDDPGATGRAIDTRTGPLVNDVNLPDNRIVRLYVGTNSSAPTSGSGSLHQCGSPVGAAARVLKASFWRVVLR